MLIEFRVENHRSLRDEQVLTMEAGRIGDEADPRPRRVAGSSESLLPVVVLYGANASGKSNVLAGLQFMRDAVLDSQRHWAPDAGVPRDPFAWGPTRAAPSLFEVAVLVDDVRYEYGFEASDSRFSEEWLYAWPNGKKQLWFERDEDNFKFGDHFKGENKLLEGLTRPNVLFLSAAVQLKHVQLQPIYEWFRRMQSFRVISTRPTYPSRLPIEMILEAVLQQLLDEDEVAIAQESPPFQDGETADFLLKGFRALLSNADFGILDFRIDKSDTPKGQRRRLRRIQLKHQSNSEDAWLPLDEESRGTQMLFNLGWHILAAIRTGGVVVVDELESSLHPILGQRIVGLFNDPETNPRNAQLIFTTHDTNLLGTTLGEPALRRDQVWFTEKDSEGASILYPLTDYKPRKAENLERGYLQGRFGAIPFLGNLTTGD
jgi:uncharacterized protein